MTPLTKSDRLRSLGERSEALKILRRIGAGSTKRADVPPSQLNEVLICADQTINMLERMRPPDIAKAVADALEAAETYAARMRERERGAA